MRPLLLLLLLERETNGKVDEEEVTWYGALVRIPYVRTYVRGGGEASFAERSIRSDGGGGGPSRDEKKGSKREHGSRGNEIYFPLLPRLFL